MDPFCRILFVCHGNICRSPMAEFILKDLAERERLSGRLEIASAGTSSEELGNPVYPPARRVLEKHHVPCGNRAAVRFRKEDYDRYDRIFCMDSANLRNLIRITDGDPEGKIALLMDLTDRPGEVSDPWYTDDFESAYNDIHQGCMALVHQLKEEIS